MEQIRFTCTCGMPLAVPASSAGKPVRCPKCKSTLTVPPPIPVARPAPRNTSCPNCGGIIALTAIICEYCGYNLRTGRAAPARSSQPSAPDPDCNRCILIAILSWVTPLMGVTLGCMASCLGLGFAARTVVVLLSCILALAGLAGAIYGIFATRRHGSEGILGHAVAGVLVSGLLLLILGRVAVSGIARGGLFDGPDTGTTLTQARAGHKTKLTSTYSDDQPLPQPPAGVLQIVKYRSPAGDLNAYITPAPRDDSKHPAIIWLTGGFTNGLDSGLWEPADPDDDQTASAFREHGIVTMYPSLRGGGGNPGFDEGFYGEVDDVIAACDYLRKQPYVDPQRIYLAGHSTGGTLAMLVAESTDQFRATFAFGPVSDVTAYGPDDLVFDPANRTERRLRAPGLWMHCIKTPTFVFEGDAGDSNISQLRLMQGSCTNPLVHFHPVQGADHFSILAPVTDLIARKILQDTQPRPAIDFSEAELTIQKTRKPRMLGR